MSSLFRQLTRAATGLSAAFVIVAAASAHAQAPTFLSEHKDWSAYSHKTGANPVCFVASKPKQAKGNYTKRGDIFAMVTDRPADNVRNEVSFVIGYPFKDGSQLDVTIGNTTFKLTTEGEHAWTTDPGTDQKMVAAMKAGATMTVVGYSSKGTKTTDTYSLSGFSASLDAIERACK